MVRKIKKKRAVGRSRVGGAAGNEPMPFQGPGERGRQLSRKIGRRKSPKKKLKSRHQKLGGYTYHKQLKRLVPEKNNFFGT